MKAFSYLNLILSLLFTNLLFGQDYTGSRTYNATNNMSMEIDINEGNQSVTITMTGPSNVWFAYGFGNNRMSGTYIILSEGNGNVVERRLSSRGSGSVLTNSFTNSNTVINAGVRTTTITRPLQGLTNDHYTFLAQEYSIPVIWAYGNGSTIAYHARRGISSIVLEGNCTETASNLSTSACNSYISPSGKTYSTTGIYKDTINNVAGCDSIITIDLTVLESVNEEINISRCESYTSDANNTYTSSGQYLETFIAQNGCDSVLTINLTILEASTNQFSIATCLGEYTSPSGKTITESGVFTDTLTNSIGCDSILEISLSLNEKIVDSINVTACGFYNSPSGKTYENTGIYTDTLISAEGCDSLVVIDLVLSEELSNTVEISGCDSVKYQDSTLVGSGSFTDSLITLNGCDSLVLVNHLVFPSFLNNLDTSACFSFLLPSGREVTETGFYIDTLQSINQCDSIIEINLNINTVNNTVETNGNSIMAQDSLADAYQWLDCNNNFERIIDETNFTFSPSESGIYAVEIVKNNCVDTSDCINMVIDNISELSQESSISIYQNNSKLIFTNLNEVKQLSILNAMGQLLYQAKPNSMQFKLDTPKAGVYILLIESERNGILSKRFSVY